jgi:N-acetylglucosaminyl-diphospho-decaprenol L-rhamnosyltransferase
VEWAVAACLVIRREAFDQIGGFDSRFFLYFEDVDFAVRLRAAGYLLRYDPTVRVFHDFRAASRSSFLAPAARHHLRSAIRFYSHHPGRLIHRRAPEMRGLGCDTGG